MALEAVVEVAIAAIFFDASSWCDGNSGATFRNKAGEVLGITVDVKQVLINKFALLRRLIEIGNVAVRG